MGWRDRSADDWLRQLQYCMAGREACLQPGCTVVCRSRRLKASVQTSAPSPGCRFLSDEVLRCGLVTWSYTVLQQMQARHAGH